MLAALLELVARLRKQCRERLWGIGIALPGPLGDTELSFVGPTALEGWSDLSILDELSVATGLPLFHSVDSVAGALGESLFGVARQQDNFFYLNMSMGLGGALIVGRAAYQGAGGNATEIGHVPLVPGGTPCYCGNAGCLERYLSMHSLAEALGLDDHDVWTQLTEARLHSPTEEALHRWCRQAANHLRDAICMIENMLDPQAIVIGGAAPRYLVQHLVHMAQPLHKSVRGHAGGNPTRILLSDRQEEGTLLGAAVLPIHEMLSPRLEVLQKDHQADTDAAELLGFRASDRR
jgi:predicted NBD/HSP70 family sugar kinase